MTSPYINDLPNASELTDPLLFGDETSIFYSHSNPNNQIVVDDDDDDDDLKPQARDKSTQMEMSLYK